MTARPPTELTLFDLSEPEIRVGGDEALAELLVHSARHLAQQRWGSALNARRIRAQLTRIFREHPDLARRAGEVDWRARVRGELARKVRPPADLELFGSQRRRLL